MIDVARKKVGRYLDRYREIEHLTAIASITILPSGIKECTE